MKKTEIFRRDGFIDRYSGEKLIYPPVLKILSVLMEKEFPYQKNWKMSETHIAWWELIPTVDHVEPVARGGEDEKENWVCTSQLRNSAKSNWKLEDLGWEMKKKGDLKKWDGMMGWFMEYMKKAPSEICNDKYIKKSEKEGKTTDKVEGIDAAGLKALSEKESVTVFDVRKPGEYLSEHIPDAKSTPLDSA